MPNPPAAPPLTELLANARQQLARGVADRRSACHTPTLGSIGAEGAPELRTVVLRGFDPATFTLRLHTDQRSPKAAQFAANPAAALHVYDPGQRLQLRLSGQVARHAGDATAQTAWAQSHPQSRVCYATPHAPGTNLAAPAPAPAPAPEAEAGGFANFLVLLFTCHRLDYLHLAITGHLRASFTREAETWHGTWRAP